MYAGAARYTDLRALADPVDAGRAAARSGRGRPRHERTGSRVPNRHGVRCPRRSHGNRATKCARNDPAKARPDPGWGRRASRPRGDRRHPLRTRVVAVKRGSARGRSRCPVRAYRARRAERLNRRPLPPPEGKASVSASCDTPGFARHVADAGDTLNRAIDSRRPAAPSRRARFKAFIGTASMEPPVVEIAPAARAIGWVSAQPRRAGRKGAGGVPTRRGPDGRTRPTS